MPVMTLADAISRFGASLNAKLSGNAAIGAPEDQLDTSINPGSRRILTALVAGGGDAMRARTGSRSPDGGLGQDRLPHRAPRSYAGTSLVLSQTNRRML